MAVELVASITKYIGLSTDTKPTSPPIGAEFTETNTGKKWVYTADGWEEDLTLIYAVYEANRA